MSSCFALVDCNNFYASCETLFRPDIKGKPIVLLSNNDGCVVARSKEAKALGIKMGIPAFELKSLIAKGQLLTFSSNYTLYADISARVMSTLEMLAPALEVYSIDEAFLDLTGVSHCMDLTDFGKTIRNTIQKHIGMTVCVGIAPTKTLSKLANHAAKKWSKAAGVVDLTNTVRQRKLMALLPVSEVWGIGSKLTARLNKLGIHTALDLADANPSFIKQQCSIVEARIVAELNGESCLALEHVAPTKKQIISSRAFGERITSKPKMHEAVSEYISRACQKLRKEQQQAKQLTVFIRTSPFSDKQREPYYGNSISNQLTHPSSDTRDFLTLGSRLLDKIWKDDYRYVRAGVMLTDFYDEGVYQVDLFEPEPPSYQSKALMTIIDTINSTGTGKVWFASQGIAQEWSMKRAMLSPHYTTKWTDLPIAR
ncbi:translesion error-prone DNA polymerase V subunit UmuC [Rheinheimera sp. UJ51]|uniref:translesion error-prone DNA polymerase V subunit UmuC n=1 Tax=Rheinheimera sp. UJ51 TaxID=2892446 RepID=UPI001E540CAD|nr:translesion error-prone DNA polymerase V subunit UmuC [Rheinheimera sp. UJ51]MCC5453357.1 translesion error-prone DNA polymerase V subunit UmuC [Rheinheimera sp. UJ51]